MFRRNAICGSITHSVYIEMGMQIVNGTFFSNGSARCEDYVCEKFQVSRSVSREAIRILATKGLIISRPKTGIAINHISQWNLFDRDVLNWITNGDLLEVNSDYIYQIRKLVEPEAMRDLCNYEDLNLLRKLRAIVETMNTLQHDTQEFKKNQILFHTTVLKASKNPFFSLFSELITNTLGKSERKCGNTQPYELLQYYVDILEAIERKNSNTAAALCKTIIDAETAITLKALPA